MAASGLQTQMPLLQPLQWESDHFSISATKLCDPNLDDDQLTDMLRQARRDGVQLLVWPASGERAVAPALLQEFNGTLADRKATFTKALLPSSEPCDSSPDAAITVSPYHSRTACLQLYQLAIAAGIYSRFAVDPHFQRERFEAMYRRWIDGSLQGELADAVLVVRPNGNPDTSAPLAGMITLQHTGDVASIGLVAVAADMRGRGLGSTLMRAADAWMLAHHANEARVVTQLANSPACRLYERSGYRLSSVQHYYHFWLCRSGFRA